VLSLMPDIRAMMVHYDLFIKQPPQRKIEPKRQPGGIVKMKQVIIPCYGKEQGHFSQQINRV
jgi:hypothetical protein